MVSLRTWPQCEEADTEEAEKEGEAEVEEVEVEAEEDKAEEKDEADGEGEEEPTAEEASPLRTQSLSGWLLSPWIHIAGQLKEKQITQAH